MERLLEDVTGKMEIGEMVHKPTLLLDFDKVNRNISRMVEKAQVSGVVLRPHFKTHQSAAIGEMFRQQGISVITVSSVDMAAYFIDQNWHDVTIAFAFNPRQVEEINLLADRARINIVVESNSAIEMAVGAFSKTLGVWIKIDTGYNRTGLPWDDFSSINNLAHFIANQPLLDFEGILTHAGHTYHARSQAEIVGIYHETVERMTQVRTFLDDHGHQVKISIGDTPGCSLVESYGQVDEIRPGNFVFFDLMQEQLGVCKEEDIAVAAACPVVAKYPARKEIVIYGGAVHLSKEFMIGEDGVRHYGRVALLNEGGWTHSLPACWVETISQEHGIIKASAYLLDLVQIGDLVAVLPVHSCLTANLLGKYLSLDGKLVEMARY